MSARQEILEYWRANHPQIVAAVSDDIQNNGGPSYKVIDRAMLQENQDNVLSIWQRYLEDGNIEALLEYTGKVAYARAQAQINVTETMYVVDVWRSTILDILDRVETDPAERAALARQIETGLHEQRKTIVGAYSEVMREAQRLLTERDQALAYQGRLIQELSTPIMPIHEGILVLPLVGAIDSRRASQVMESALEKIVEYQADVMILDITGVPVVDTCVANYLLQMARAIKLLGANVVLVGIGAEIAQTIVQLGVELNDVTTRSNLQSGIEYALTRRGYAIRANR
jgi:rsbT co-antagonist protein RsbR